MPQSFVAFFEQMAENPPLLGVTLLTLAVLLVNGWTDAPNAIAGAVATGALPFRPAVALAAACNFLGVLCVTAVNASVAETVYSIASFGGGPGSALTALCAAMAVRSGMDTEDALAAITSHAAEIGGISRRVGSLAPGKDADILVTRGHPLAWNSTVEAVFIDGIRVES